MRRHILSFVAICCIFANPLHVQGCAWCSFIPPKSLLERYLDAEMVVVAWPKNAVEPNNALPNGQTELVFSEVLKPHKLLKNRKSILTPRFIATKDSFIVAMEIQKGQIDAYFGTPIDANGAILKYVRGAMQLKDKSPLARARYNVDFLRDPCMEVAESAHLEINRASHEDIRKIAVTLKPEPLVKALTSVEALPTHRGAFAILLGYCGKKADAVVIRKLIDAADQKKDGGLPSFLFAYVLLEPKEGWDFVTKYSLQPDESSFLKRYAALQAIRKLGAECKDLVPRKQWDDAMLGILNVKDMADFAVEDFRKLKRWEHCDAVLDLSGKPGYESPIMRLAILRFALQCPTPRAKAFVNEQRARNAAWVKDTEELLALE